MAPKVVVTEPLSLETPKTVLDKRSREAVRLVDLVISEYIHVDHLKDKV